MSHSFNHSTTTEASVELDLMSRESFTYLDVITPLRNRKLALLTSVKQLTHDLETWEPLIDCDVETDECLFPPSEQFDGTEAAFHWIADPDHLMNDETIADVYQSDREDHMTKWLNIVKQHKSSKELDSLDVDFWKYNSIIL